MSDIREKVARAIADVLYLDGQPSVDIENGTDWLCADAAIAACGYEEMRTALENAKLQIEYLHDKYQHTGTGNHALQLIDAALKAGGS